MKIQWLSNARYCTIVAWQRRHVYSCLIYLTFITLVVLRLDENKAELWLTLILMILTYSDIAKINRNTAQHDAKRLMRQIEGSWFSARTRLIAQLPMICALLILLIALMSVSLVCQKHIPKSRVITYQWISLMLITLGIKSCIPLDTFRFFMVFKISKIRAQAASRRTFPPS